MLINVVIVDDHRIIIDGISSLLESSHEIKVINSYFSAEDLLENIVEDNPDILLLDIDLPGMDGITCAEHLLGKYPKMNIAILTMHDEKGLIERLMNIGVKGYFLKTIEANELKKALHTIHSGSSYFPEATMQALEKEPEEKRNKNIDPRIAELSKRELEIAQLIAQGMSNKEIGEQLFISDRTVGTHRYNLMGKLEVNNVADLVRFMAQNGLLS